MDEENDQELNDDEIVGLDFPNHSQARARSLVQGRIQRVPQKINEEPLGKTLIFFCIFVKE